MKKKQVLIPLTVLVGVLLVGCIVCLVFCNGRGQEDSGVPQNTDTDTVTVGGSNVEIDTDIPQDLSSDETDKAETSTSEDGPFVEDSTEEEILDKPTSTEEDLPTVEDNTVVVPPKTEEESPVIDSGEENKNAPVFNPAIGGKNPFDNDSETQINDRPVEDFIGSGEDRPGEGIHF